MVGLTEAMALEWAPYLPDPDQIDAADISECNKLAATRAPLGRVGKLREVGLLAYLASDASAYVTGQTSSIDGGAGIA